jgi:head-tail adaptor
MRAGELRIFAAIQQNTPSQDVIGGETKSWSTFLSPWWCALDQVVGGQMFRGKIVHAEANYVACGRFVAGVTTAHRVLIGDRQFAIKARANIDECDVELRLDLFERDV